MDATSTFLYVANSSSNDVSAFQINRMTGALTPVPGSRFPVSSEPKEVALVSSANLMFVANEGSNDISAFKIDPMTGALTPVGGSPFGGVDSPFGLAVNPVRTFLYANDINENTVSEFLRDSTTGTLIHIPGFSFATGQTPIGLLRTPMASPCMSETTCKTQCQHAALFLRAGRCLGYQVRSRVPQVVRLRPILIRCVW